ncbi:hypothetical protein [Shinella sp.]|jgi:hypothetical protein|uniref:hypothetical protein n=1 Tax=Shinella sp. TaxID=1870904 RepID=UPI003F7308C2
MEKPSWRIRRRIIVGTLVYCAAMILYLAVWGKSTSLEEAIATGLILLAGSVIGSYVFGAVWDDRNVMKAREQSEHAPPADFPPGGAS